MPTRPLPSGHRVGILRHLVVVGAIAALLGCTPAASETTAAPSPPPSPATSLPAPAPSPTEPPEMTRDDETGALAAARYFVDDLYRYTESTQDTDSWTAMSHDSCIFCRSVLDDVNSLRGGRRLVYPAAVRVQSQSVKRLNPLAYTVTLDVLTGPDEVWSLDGTPVGTGSQHTGRMTLVMVNQQKRWLTREVQLDQVS